MPRQSIDPYLVLGVSPTASQADITHAYRTRLRAHHPDTRRSSSSPTADEQLRQLLAAYALLRDTARRAEYDRVTADAANARTQSTVVRIPADRYVAGPAQIPIIHRRSNTRTNLDRPPLLWAGPVRRHR